jgi:hypothetical protein
VPSRRTAIRSPSGPGVLRKRAPSAPVFAT